MTSSKLTPNPAPARREGSPLRALHPARGAQLVRRLDARRPSAGARRPRAARARGRSAPRPTWPSRSPRSCAPRARPATRTATATGWSRSTVSSRASRARPRRRSARCSQSFGEQLAALQQDMARALAATATQLARQIVRSELATRPELVAAVAQEALDTLLLSAQHITLRVHPDDHALVAQAPAEVLAARGARLRRRRADRARRLPGRIRHRRDRRAHRRRAGAAPPRARLRRGLGRRRCRGTHPSTDELA